jgi:GTPase SAR1 family protein
VDIAEETAREDANQVFKDISKEHANLQREQDAVYDKLNETTNAATVKELRGKVQELDARLKGVLRQFRSLERASLERSRLDLML